MTSEIYIVKNAGAVGPNAAAHDVVIVDNSNSPLEGVDFLALAAQLNSLKQVMSSSAQRTSDYDAVASISAAEDAVRNNDKTNAVIKLKAAGIWAFETATRIGTSVAADALKQAIGLR